MIGSGSIGLPCPGADVRRDRPGRRRVPADDQPGEIVVRAPGLMRGYLNRPEATAETFRGGWLHTGDLGRRDAAGYLYFVGRIKDVIRRGGREHRRGRGRDRAALPSGRAGGGRRSGP